MESAEEKFIKKNIREYKPNDFCSLMDVAREVWGDDEHKIIQQRFSWQYLENPNNLNGKPLLFVMEAGNQLIGMVGGIPVKLKVEDAVYHADWVGDFMIHPKYRGKAGLLLARKIRDNCQVILGFPALYVTNLWRRVGCVDICRYTTLRRVMDFDHLLEEKNWPSQCVYLVNFLWRRVDHLINYLNSRKKVSVKIVSINYFDERFDQFWQEISPEYPVIGVRDRTFLNWRFIQCPHQQYRIYTAQEKNNILGYVVIRDFEIEEGVKVGLIVDFLVSKKREDVFYELMQKAVNELKEAEVQYIDIVAVTSHKAFIKNLQKLGFIFNILGAPGVCYVKNEHKLYHAMQEPSNWYVTMADSDEELS